MPNYRVVPIWSQSVMGASETYYTSDVSPTTAATQIQQLLAARANLLFDNQLFQGVRVSQWGQKRRSVMMVPPFGIIPGTTTRFNIPTQGSLPSSSATLSPTQMRSVLQIRLTYDTNRTAIRYLGGIPNQDVGPEPASFNYNATPQWGKNLSAFANLLVSGVWNMQARDRGSASGPFMVIQVVQQSAAPGYLGVGLTTSAAPALSIGQKILLQNFRPAKGTHNATLNGSWYIDSLNTTLNPGVTYVYLRGSQGIDPATQRFTSTTALWIPNMALFTIQNFETVRVGIHKRGRPFNSPRGRRLSRTSLDP